jgi:Spy/CpxP family protein refolding chaperone
MEHGHDMPGMDGMDLEEEGGPGPEDGMSRDPEVQKKLNLSDDQRTRLADIRDRQTRAAIPIRSDLEIAGLDLRKLMRADKPDQKAIDAQIDKMAGLRARLQKSRVASMLEARAVLTPAQQKTLREARPRMGRGMRGHRGMHGDFGGPGSGT